jgi:hypothetical protein
MDRRAIIATHHKTGTVWMASTFRGICRALDLPFALFTRGTVEAAGVGGPSVLIDHHAIWYGAAASRWHREDDRVFHLVRDPRDVVISAMHYHRTAKEPWLHAPKDEFGGLSYRQKLDGFASDGERYLFEMSHSAGRTIAAMTNWNYERPECFECRYEDLIEDTDAALFTDALRHLGFQGKELNMGRRQFRRHAIFAGKAAKVADRRAAHVRSGATGQWRSVFDRALGEAFITRFGDALVRLGYERDDSWLQSLPPSPARASDIEREAAHAG